jgi:hypothetical protein
MRSKVYASSWSEDGDTYAAVGSGLNNILHEESQTGQMLDRTAGHVADKDIVPSKLFHSQISKRNLGLLITHL